jgi:1-deoxy-D-xylulose-5-phosphate reductoisomerase
MPRRIVILGATGSIGRSTIEVVQAAPDEYEIAGLAAGSRWEDLAELVARCKPGVAVIAAEEHEAALRARVNGSTEVLSGAAALCEMVSRPGVDFVVSAIVGSAGLRATHTAIRAGRTIGLANKEALVAAGFGDHAGGARARRDHPSDRQRALGDLSGVAVRPARRGDVRVPDGVGRAVPDLEP